VTDERTSIKSSDIELGMDRPISRRDFVQGVAVSTLTAPLLSACDLTAVAFPRAPRMCRATTRHS